MRESEEKGKRELMYEEGKGEEGNNDVIEKQMKIKHIRGNSPENGMRGRMG